MVLLDPVEIEQDHVAHCIEEQRHGEERTPPEAAAHVDQLGIRAFVERDCFRLERHAADRAGSRSLLADLRVHRAGVDRALRSEEHTSEHQSLMRISYAAFCLKKKKKSQP